MAFRNKLHRKQKSNKIPDGWADCSPLGIVLQGTRFIAFKVPLEKTISHDVPPLQNFTPAMLMEKIPTLGLIIDLTNTDRYYHKKVFTENNIEYQKIWVKGQQVPPTSDLMRFYNIVDKFLMENANNELLIGVHCTHGINRTGYFICKYLIDRVNYRPADAIMLFNSARGEKMYREYLLRGINQNTSQISGGSGGRVENVNSYGAGYGSGFSYTTTGPRSTRNVRDDYEATIAGQVSGIQISNFNDDYDYTRDYD